MFGGEYRLESRGETIEGDGVFTCEGFENRGVKGFQEREGIIVKKGGVLFAKG